LGFNLPELLRSPWKRQGGGSGVCFFEHACRHGREYSHCVHAEYVQQPLLAFPGKHQQLAQHHPELTFPRARQDQRPPAQKTWRHNDSTVPIARHIWLEDEHFSIARELKAMVYMQNFRRVAALGVQGCGGGEITTACTIVAHDPDARDLYVHFTDTSP
jgi:hypothetical protein